VLPCYRVEPHIEAVVAGIPSWIGDVIAVDDKSPDGTLAALERIRDPRLVVLRHAENRGVGGAMQTGFAEALRRGVDVVVKMDGDGQMDPEQLAKLVDPLVRGKAD
jgi:glycosyltransferase involved in cell wall biosynthesis